MYLVSIVTIVFLATGCSVEPLTSLYGQRAGGLPVPNDYTFYAYSELEFPGALNPWPSTDSGEHANRFGSGDYNFECRESRIEETELGYFKLEMKASPTGSNSEDEESRVSYIPVFCAGKMRMEFSGIKSDYEYQITLSKLETDKKTLIARGESEFSTAVDYEKFPIEILFDDEEIFEGK